MASFRIAALESPAVALGIPNVGSGHTRDLRDRFLNGWFRWFFEINAQFEILPGKTR
jgi:hypothetical protein